MKISFKTVVESRLRAQQGLCDGVGDVFRKAISPLAQLVDGLQGMERLPPELLPLPRRGAPLIGEELGAELRAT